MLPLTDAMRTPTHDYLYDDKSGLPESFSSDEIDARADAVLAHLLVVQRQQGKST